MTTSEFYSGLQKYLAENSTDVKNWRSGQAVFNYAVTIDERVADELRGTQYDPFYNDCRIEQFIDEFINGLTNISADKNFYKLVHKLREWCTKNEIFNAWSDDWESGYECSRLSSMHEIKSILKEMRVDV
jgi:hypothetical protein